MSHWTFTRTWSCGNLKKSKTNTKQCSLVSTKALHCFLTKLIVPRWHFLHLSVNKKCWLCKYLQKLCISRVSSKFNYSLKWVLLVWKENIAREEAKLSFCVVNMGCMHFCRVVQYSEYQIQLVHRVEKWSHKTTLNKARAMLKIQFFRLPLLLLPLASFEVLLYGGGGPH